MDQFEQDILLRAACGNQVALDFVNRGFEVFHMVDDLVDETTTAEFKLRTVIKAMELYCHPYFLKHGVALHGVIRNCADVWMQSVIWEKHPDKARANWAEVTRHCGLDLACAVADIEGGWDHRRQMSEEIRAYNLGVSAKEKTQ